MKNLKIGKKLLITFGIIIVLFLITVILSIKSLMQTGNEFEDFYTNGYPVSNTTTDMRRAAQTAMKAISLSMQTTDEQKTAEYVSQAEEQLSQVSDGFDFLGKNFRGDMAAVEEAKSVIEEAKDYRVQILDLATQNTQSTNEQAMQLFFDKYEPLMGDFQTKMTAIDQATTDLAAEGHKESQGLQKSSLILMIVIAVVALLATVFLATYITKSLTKPIGEIGDAASKMAEGDLNVTVAYQSKDELGVLSEKIRHLTETLKAIIGDEDYLLSEMANGNFDVKTGAEDRYVGDFSAILMSLRKINTSLSDTLDQINQSSDQVASGSGQVASGAQALSQGSTEQASSVQELAATINEISDQVKNNASNADEARNLADQVGAEMTDSNQKMQEMITAMQEISNSSNEIGKIIKTIEDIAFQTNILALNAAVEAARAGEAGKGFAVVADEVRNLASKSADASQNTSTLIETAIKDIGHGTEIADETAKSLLTAVEGAQSVTDIVEKISKASNEQAKAVEQVTQGIDQISQVVQTNSATAEESAAASEEMSGQAQVLKELISRFKLKQSGKSGVQTMQRMAGSSVKSNAPVSNNADPVPAFAGDNQKY